MVSNAIRWRRDDSFSIPGTSTKVGGLIEMKVYEVPRAPATPHGSKYSLAYVRDGRRVLGYDNHERKGDHRHVGRLMTPYRFISVGQLIDDFLEDLTSAGKEKAP